jgi:hypothetical protein
VVRDGLDELLPGADRVEEGRVSLGQAAGVEAEGLLAQVLHGLEK